MIERQWHSAITTDDGENNHKEHDVGGQPVKLFSTLSWVIKVKDNSERYCWLTYEKRPNGGHSPIGHQQVFRPARIGADFTATGSSLWQPFATSLGIHFSFETSCCQMWVGPYCLSQWKQISFVDLLNGLHREGPEANLGCGSNEPFVSSSPLKNTGARECEQSNQATVSPTNSLTH